MPPSKNDFGWGVPLLRRSWVAVGLVAIWQLCIWYTIADVQASQLRQQRAHVADVVAVMRLGAVDFLEKPVDPQLLLSTLRTLESRYDCSIDTRVMHADVSSNSVPFRYRVLAYEKLLIEESLMKHDGHVGRVDECRRCNGWTASTFAPWCSSLLQRSRAGCARTFDGQVI